MAAVLALVCFLLAAFGVQLLGLAMVPLGLFFVTLHLLWPWYPGGWGPRRSP